LQKPREMRFRLVNVHFHDSQKDRLSLWTKSTISSLGAACEDAQSHYPDAHSPLLRSSWVRRDFGSSYELFPGVLSE
jgi:hypothetical protein